MSYVIALPPCVGGPAAAAALLESVRSRCLEMAAQIIGDHVWQVRSCAAEHAVHGCVAGARSWVHERACGAGRPAAQVDAFELRPVPAGADGELREATARFPCLVGDVRFGDSVSDEWLVVSLLRALSRSSLLMDAAVRITDADGDFLLIEAADALPEWLAPDVSANRVFLVNGALHIVPPAAAAAATDAPPPLRLAEALEIVHGHGVRTLAPPGVQAAVDRALARYPAAALAEAHTVRLIAPRSLLWALRRDPGLAAACAVAFYYRDPTDVSRARRMVVTDPGSHGLAAASVRLTRCLYAQLSQTPFHAPKGYPPPPQDASPADARAWDLGMRLACGAEYVAQHGPGRDVVRAGATPMAVAAAAAARGGADGAHPSLRLLRHVLAMPRGRGGDDAAWIGEAKRDDPDDWLAAGAARWGAHARV